jgi:hypothetical protein
MTWRLPQEGERTSFLELLVANFLSPPILVSDGYIVQLGIRFGNTRRAPPSRCVGLVVRVSGSWAGVISGQGDQRTG